MELPMLILSSLLKAWVCLGGVALILIVGDVFLADSCDSFANEVQDDFGLLIAARKHMA